MKLYKVIFHPEAQKELLSLDGSIRIIVLKQLKKLEQFPQLGELLGNKHGYDLTGYRKIYASDDCLIGKSFVSITKNILFLPIFEIKNTAMSN